MPSATSSTIRAMDVGAAVEHVEVALAEEVDGAGGGDEVVLGPHPLEDREVVPVDRVLLDREPAAALDLAGGAQVDDRAEPEAAGLLEVVAGEPVHAVAAVEQARGGSIGRRPVGSPPRSRTLNTSSNSMLRSSAVGSGANASRAGDIRARYRSPAGIHGGHATSIRVEVDARCDLGQREAERSV